jgi:hypothetical protein
LSKWGGAAVLFGGALAAGWLLARAGILTNENAERVSKVVTVGSAGFLAIAADTPASNPLLIELAGRIAIFFICYYFFGIIFTFALSSIAQFSEKAAAKDAKLPPKAPPSVQSPRAVESPAARASVCAPPPPKIAIAPRSSSKHPERYCAICRTLVLPKRLLFRRRECPTCHSSL